MRISRTTACLIALVLLFMPAPDAQAQAPEVDGTAEKVLREALTRVGQADSFHVQTTSVVEQFAPGRETTIRVVTDVTFARPNRLALRVSESTVSVNGAALPPDEQPAFAEMICDGTNLTIRMPNLDERIVRPAPENFDNFHEIAVVPQGAALTGGQIVPMLLNTSPYDAVVQPTTGLEYVGEEKIDGSDCHHIKVSLNGPAASLWITTGSSPVLRRMAVSGGGGFSVRDDYSEWAFGISPDAEAFALPKPATRPDGGNAWTPLRLDGELRGEPAASGPLKMLDGGRFDLSKHKGKHVVVLDFWATWCAPCRRGLPLLAKVVKNYEDKGVVAYAVNVAEDEKRVKAFMENADWSLPIPLDTDRKLSRRYRVQGIPRTVIIDKDGIVRHIHEGAGPDLEKILTAALDRVLRGAKESDEAGDDK